jgi:hypothetical protein
MAPIHRGVSRSGAEALVLLGIPFRHEKTRGLSRLKAGGQAEDGNAGSPSWMRYLLTELRAAHQP